MLGHVIFHRFWDVISYLLKFKEEHIQLSCMLYYIVLLNISQHNKSEVPSFTNSIIYEDMKGDTKCRKWGGLGVFKGHLRSFDKAHTIWYY